VTLIFANYYRKGYRNSLNHQENPKTPVQVHAYKTFHQARHPLTSTNSLVYKKQAHSKY